ncbi:MAG: TetR/AcrR family transcriptional regulator [Gammaproteobacteria bacterium]|jgi:AcrR family transcriptional regulator|nr:TetR/AcrR family transcriptional regulator [Gammaproteobacteria bacterium]
MKRMTRSEQVESNREAILDSAKEHFARFGYHGASLDAIADAAGFSKGAIYSQFGSKDDLMLATLERNVRRRHDATAKLIAALGDELRPEDVLRHAYARSLEDAGWQAALIEFRIHASRHPAVNRQYAALHERTIELTARTLASQVARFGIVTDRSPRDLAIAHLASGLGLVVESFVIDGLDVVEYLSDLALLLSPPVSTRRTET